MAKIKVNNVLYEYEIRKDDKGEKHLRFKGIVTYPELVRIKEKLRKKYKWL